MQTQPLNLKSALPVVLVVPLVEVIEESDADRATMPWMRPVAGEVRHSDLNLRLICTDPIHLLNHRNRVIQVLQDMIHHYFAHRVVRKRPRQRIKVVDHIDVTGVGVVINVHESRHASTTTSEVQPEQRLAPTIDGRRHAEANRGPVSSPS
jgi:hypothetical protein